MSYEHSFKRSPGKLGNVSSAFVLLCPPFPFWFLSEHRLWNPHWQKILPEFAQFGHTYVRHPEKGIQQAREVRKEGLSLWQISDPPNLYPHDFQRRLLPSEVFPIQGQPTSAVPSSISATMMNTNKAHIWKILEHSSPAVHVRSQFSPDYSQGPHSH